MAELPLWKVAMTRKVKELELPPITSAIVAHALGRGRAVAGPARGGAGAGAGMGPGESGAAGRNVAADLRAPIRAAEWHDAAPVADASARPGGAAPAGEDGGEYRPGRGGSRSGIGGHAAGSLRARRAAMGRLHFFCKEFTQAPSLPVVPCTEPMTRNKDQYDMLTKVQLWIIVSAPIIIGVLVVAAFMAK